MSDERKDQNLPARPTSSLMGQLVRQRQTTGGEVAPAPPPQQQQGGQLARQGGPGGGMATPGQQGGAPAAQGPSRAELDRLDQRADENEYGHGGVSETTAGDTGRFQANQGLIREREKVIIDQLRRELDTSRMTQISEDTQAQVRARIREIVNSDPAPLTMMEKGILLQNILDEVFGFGPLGPLLRDPSVGDICVNGPNNVYVERHG